MDAATLRAWRDARGLSRREAAPLLGINVRTLEDLEYGRSPNSALWGAIARVIELMGDTVCASQP
jgi:DNA-binding transcriptional regulator YiaG